MSPSLNGTLSTARTLAEQQQSLGGAYFPTPTAACTGLLPTNKRAGVPYHIAGGGGTSEYTS